MAKTAYESITGHETFDYAKFKATVKELNESGLIPNKINVVGKKEVVVKKFLDAIEKIPEGDTGKMPDSVFDMNNTFIDILEASDNSSGEESEGKEEESDTPGGEKRDKKKAKGEPTISNKFLVWSAWFKSEKKATADELLSQIEEKVKLKTIKAWIKNWDKGQKFPKGAE